MHKDRILLVVAAVFAALLAGCVERQLTIVTEPPGAMVTLNDEQIGVSPVTVSFNWYGDYWVRLSKDGYQTLDTHRELKGPWYDHFPFDFVVQIADPTRVVERYQSMAFSRPWRKGTTGSKPMRFRAAVMSAWECLTSPARGGA